MPTSRFTDLCAVPERSYRRWQARARQGCRPKGSWPTPTQDRVEQKLVEVADRAGVGSSQDRGVGTQRRPAGVVLHGAAGAQTQRPGVDTGLHARAAGSRRGAAGGVRRATLGAEPGVAAGLHRVRDHPGRHWRISGCADYWAKAELGWHVSISQNHHNAITAIELAIDEAERLHDRSLLELVADPATGELRPIAVVSDNGPAFKATGFARFIDSRPELIHIRTRRKSPQQNGVRERAFGSLKYEHLYRLDIPDGPTLAAEGRGLPTDVQLDPTARSDRHDATDGPLPGDPARGADTNTKRARNPATFLKRDNSVLMT